MTRVRRLKFILWLVAGLAAAVAVARFVYGLGVTTNLSDATPWGLWVGFDLSAVAVAAGGFVLTATVYIFKLERFHKIVRLGVLAAFVLYLSFVAILLFELGLPWRIWHMVVYWNVHSPLFEVGWCVMLYTGVLVLEFFPTPAEEFPRLAKLRALLIKARMPLVILGIGLSTMHQSSLGSLFLIMPYRLHPLWYTPILPLLFLISAIALGLLMVIFENHFTAYFFRREPETATLADLGGAARWLLVSYAIIRLGDLALRGSSRYLAAPGWPAMLFWLEIATITVVPAVLLSLPRLRRSVQGQWLAASAGVFGVVLNRVDVGGLAHLGHGNELYVPAWTEIVISAGIVAAAALAFLFVIERFRIWEQRPADPDADPAALPKFDRVGTTWLGEPAIAGRTVYSLAFVAAAAVGFALIESQPVDGRGIVPQPVHRARGGDTLWIDGNLNGYGVAFPHAKIEARLGGEASCVKCHHMNVPRDRNSGCYECHRDMYLTTDASRHDWHASPDGGRLACRDCHDSSRPRTALVSKKCDYCHKNLVPQGATIQVKNYKSVGYVQAMHALCIDCHVNLAKQTGKPEFARCATCHKERRARVDAPELAERERIGRGMLLPAVAKR